MNIVEISMSYGTCNHAELRRTIRAMERKKKRNTNLYRWLVQLMQYRDGAAQKERRMFGIKAKARAREAARIGAKRLSLELAYMTESRRVEILADKLMMFWERDVCLGYG